MTEELDPVTNITMSRKLRNFEKNLTLAHDHSLHEMLDYYAHKPRTPFVVAREHLLHRELARRAGAIPPFEDDLDEEYVEPEVSATPELPEPQMTLKDIASRLGVSLSSASSYKRGPGFPEPDGELGGTSWWWTTTIANWEDVPGPQHPRRDRPGRKQSKRKPKPKSD